MRVSMKSIKVLIVPEWIEVPIKAAGESLSIITHPEKLLRILSKDDVAFYVRTITGFLNYCDKELSESIDANNAYDGTWKSLVSNNLDEDGFGRAMERSIAELGSIESVADYLSFIMKHGANGCVLDPTQTLLGFDVIGYDYDNYLLRPKAVSDTELYQCYEDLFAVMHKYMATHEIASLPIFKLYESQINRLAALR